MFDHYFEVFDRLGESGYAILDAFLSTEEVAALRQRITDLEREGCFFKAGIGKLQHHTVNQSVRGDFIHWVDPAEEAANPEEQIVQRIVALRQWLNRHYFLALRDQELHLAHYPPGTFYKRHTDQFLQQQHRVLSVVLYLNPDWSIPDGGELQLYLPVGGPLLVEPRGGRLLIFRSNLEHEVLPTAVDRYSLTGWLLDQEVGLTFL